MIKESSQVGGIVLIVTAKSDLNRVIERLQTLFRINATAYCGPMTTMNIETWERFSSAAMIYLELEHGIWGDVVHWCDSAERAGLVARYHYAQVDRVHHSEDNPEQGA